MSVKKILITGISGFVGSQLAPYLHTNCDYQISALIRGNSIITSELKNNIKSLIDINKQMNAYSFNHYIHLAGKAHDLKNTSDDFEYFKVNYELTKKLFDRFLKDEQATTFIFISSVKAIADSVEGALKEEHFPAPVTAYGQSKLKAEKYIIDNLPENKKAIILRPCMIHGPGNKGNLNLLFSIVKRGLPWPLGAYENSRSFLSIENLCFVIKEILEGKLESGVYNVADDETFSTNNLIELIAESQNKKPRVLKVPQSFIKIVSKAGDVLKLPLNTERLQKLTENFVVSNAKLKAALGKELPVSGREGLLSTFNSFNK